MREMSAASRLAAEAAGAGSELRGCTVTSVLVGEEVSNSTHHKFSIRQPAKRNRQTPETNWPVVGQIRCHEKSCIRSVGGPAGYLGQYVGAKPRRGGALYLGRVFQLPSGGC